MLEKLKYSAVMFVAGSCYGIIVPMVTLAQSRGFATPQIMLTQYTIAVLIVAVAYLIFSRRRVALKDALKLMGMGLVAAGVSFFYYQSLMRVPPAASLTLLFQFVWMGMIVQAVRTKKLPGANSLVAVVMVIIGAALATGLFDDGVSSDDFNAWGIVFGLMAALCYTAFLTLSSVTATSVHTLDRTLFTTSGSLVLALIIGGPTYAEAPMILMEPGISLAQGIVGICIPVFLINLSSPKLPTGLTTIMASSELPSGVICAALFLGTVITFTVGLGVAIVLAGIVVSELDTVVSLAKRKASESASPPTTRESP